MMRHLKFLEIFLKMEKKSDFMTMNRSMLLEDLSHCDLSLENAFIEISNALSICPFLSDLAQRLTFDLPNQIHDYVEKV